MSRFLKIVGESVRLLNSKWLYPSYKKKKKDLEIVVQKYEIRQVMKRHQRNAQLRLIQVHSFSF